MSDIEEELLDNLYDFGSLDDLDDLALFNAFDNGDDAYLGELICVKDFGTIEEKYPKISEVFSMDKIKALKLVKSDGLELKNLPIYQDDKEVAGIAIVDTLDAFIYVSDSLKEDANFILVLLDSDEDLMDAGILKYIPQKLFKDKKFMLELLEIETGISDINIFEYADKDLVNGKLFLKKAINVNFSVIYDIDEKFLADKEIMMIAVNKHGLTLEQASEELKSDKELVLTAIANYGEAIIYASDQLQSDKEFILKAIRIKTSENVYIDFDAGVFPNLSKEMQADEEIVLTSIKHNYLTLANASVKFNANRDIVLEAVKFGWALEFVNEKFKDDKEIVLKAMEDVGAVYLFASERLQLDKDIILSFIGYSDFVLNRLNDDMTWTSRGSLHQDVVIDKEIALALVNKDAEYLKDLEEFQDDIDIVIAAIKNNKNSIEYAEKSLQKNKKVLNEYNAIKIS